MKPALARSVYSNQNKPSSKENVAKDVNHAISGKSKQDVDQSRNSGQDRLKGESTDSDRLRGRSVTTTSGGPAINSPTAGPDILKRSAESETATSGKNSKESPSNSSSTSAKATNTSKSN